MLTTDPITVETMIAVQMEAISAIEMHGPLTRDNDRAIVILAEEFGESAAAVLELNRSRNGRSDESVETRAAELIGELTQLAATAMLMIENVKNTNAEGWACRTESR